MSQKHVLEYLQNENDGVHQAEMARNSSISKASASKSVTRLEKKNLVKVDRDQAPPYNVYLTEKGRNYDPERFQGIII